jgi:hypothetical protein
VGGRGARVRREERSAYNSSPQGRQKAIKSEERGKEEARRKCPGRAHSACAVSAVYADSSVVSERSVERVWTVMLLSIRCAPIGRE